MFGLRQFSNVTEAAEAVVTKQERTREPNRTRLKGGQGLRRERNDVDLDNGGWSLRTIFCARREFKAQCLVAIAVRSVARSTRLCRFWDA